MFGTKEKEKEVTPMEPIRRSVETNPYQRRKLLITGDQIKALNEIVNKARSVDFDMAIVIENDNLMFKFGNDLIAIDTENFVCRDSMVTPDGPDVAEDVEKFSKTYLPGEEIKKMQREILDSNNALTSENVKHIETTVADTLKSINALANVLSSMPVKEFEPKKIPVEDDDVYTDLDELSDTQPLPLVDLQKKETAPVTTK